jgi:hypothetical protein
LLDFNIKIEFCILSVLFIFPLIWSVFVWLCSPPSQFPGAGRVAHYLGFAAAIFPLVVMHPARGRCRSPQKVCATIALVLLVGVIAVEAILHAHGFFFLLDSVFPAQRHSNLVFPITYLIVLWHYGVYGTKLVFIAVWRSALAVDFLFVPGFRW